MCRQRLILSGTGGSVGLRECNVYSYCAAPVRLPGLMQRRACSARVRAWALYCIQLVCKHLSCQPPAQRRWGAGAAWDQGVRRYALPAHLAILNLAFLPPHRTAAGTLLARGCPSTAASLRGRPWQTPGRGSPRGLSSRRVGLEVSGGPFNCALLLWICGHMHSQIFGWPRRGALPAADA